MRLTLALTDGCGRAAETAEQSENAQHRDRSSDDVTTLPHRSSHML